MNSLNCKNVNQVPPTYQDSDEEFYHVVKCQLLSKGVATGKRGSGGSAQK